MKKIIRIILSPIIFLVMFGGLIIIPFGPGCLFVGLIMKFYCWITDKSDSPDNPEWWFIFVWVVGPYIEAKKFINGEPMS